MIFLKKCWVIITALSILFLVSLTTHATETVNVNFRSQGEHKNSYQYVTSNSLVIVHGHELRIRVTNHTKSSSYLFFTVYSEAYPYTIPVDPSIMDRITSIFLKNTNNHLNDSLEQIIQKKKVIIEGFVAPGNFKLLKLKNVSPGFYTLQLRGYQNTCKGSGSLSSL